MSICSVILPSRWFPPVLAVVQTVRHLVLIAYPYWEAAQSDHRFNVRTFVSRDFARPFFEPYGFCGAWTRYSSGHAGDLGLDFPAYVVATLFHSVASWSVSCEDALMTPRGHVVTAVFVPCVWFLTGSSIRRLAQRRWRGRLISQIGRSVLALCLILLPFGILWLVGSVIYLLAGDVWQAIRFVGLGFWFLYAAAMAAERLRYWPFDQIAPEVEK